MSSSVIREYRVYIFYSFKFILPDVLLILQKCREDPLYPIALPANGIAEFGFFRTSILYIDKLRIGEAVKVGSFSNYGSRVLCVAPDAVLDLSITELVLV